MTKRFVVLAISALLIASLAATGEAKKKPRKVTREATAPYDTPAPGLSSGPFVANCASPSTGCVQFGTGTTERFASFTIEDAAGLPAAGGVWTGESTDLTLIAQFCGTTEEPISFSGGENLTVTIHATSSPSNVCPGAATNGTVTGTFSNLP